MPALPSGVVIDNLIAAQITASSHPFHERKFLAGNPKFLKIPHCIYFYHIKFLADGQPQLTWYFKDNLNTAINYEDLKDYLIPLAQNAHIGGQDPEPVGAGMDNMLWERISYVVFLMDSDFWKFHKYQDVKPAILCAADSETVNHTFFDADVTLLNVAETGPAKYRSAAFFINHMKKNEAGDELRYKPDGSRDRQNFKLEMYFDVVDVTGDLYPWKIDPDGTNLGPPVPPPA